MTDASAALGVAYLDSSALVKLVVVEPESAALREAIKPWSGAPTTSLIAHVEVPRAVFAAGASGNRVVLILASVATIPLSDSVIVAARSLRPAHPEAAKCKQSANNCQDPSGLQRFVAVAPGRLGSPKTPVKPGDSAATS